MLDLGTVDEIIRVSYWDRCPNRTPLRPHLFSCQDPRVLAADCQVAAVQSPTHTRSNNTTTTLERLHPLCVGGRILSWHAWISIAVGKVREVAVCMPQNPYLFHDYSNTHGESQHPLPPLWVPVLGGVCLVGHHDSRDKSCSSAFGVFCARARVWFGSTNVQAYSVDHTK